MKKTLLLFSLFVISFFANAQKKQNTYFFKDNGKEVELKDSADFIRIIQEPDSGDKKFILQEFYMNGTRKTIGKISSFIPKIAFEGLVISYHRNGLKKSSIFYEKDVPVGKSYHFFENGKLQKELEYLPKEIVKNKSAEPDFGPRFKLVYQVDSLGKVYVTEGNGHLIEYTKTKEDTLIEEGDYKDGFKDGVWKGKYVSGKSSYVENYALTKLVSGVNTVDGKIYEYTTLGSPPKYKGGVDVFYRYLANTVKYPRDAFSNDITGSVVVSFIVEKDGKVSGAKVDKPVYPSLDKEAIRVVMASPKWMPGMQRGVPVRVKYNIPINFSMQ
ncbi:MAG: TonB family protein [Acinetobacter sp.]|nr:MAG: TonB family protein [Acinetobacter sp.]